LAQLEGGVARKGMVCGAANVDAFLTLNWEGSNEVNNLDCVVSPSLAMEGREINRPKKELIKCLLSNLPRYFLSLFSILVAHLQSSSVGKVALEICYGENDFLVTYRG
jgi:hypothetical protein